MPYLPKVGFSMASNKAHFSKSLPVVKGIELYQSTVVVVRHPRKQIRRTNSKRGQITKLSSKSLARLAFIAFNTSVDFRSMQTLTYEDILIDGKGVKKDLNRFLEWYRHHFPSELYLWWLEFQRRGSPHFHILSTVDLSRFGKLATISKKNRLGRKTGKSWQTHWDTWQMLESSWRSLGGGFTAWEVIRDQDGGKKYAAKYATKAYQKQVPEAFQNAGRFWGHSRSGVKPDPKERFLCDEVMLRKALEQGGWDHLSDDEDILYRELFQAAQLIDTKSLASCSTAESFDYDMINEDYVFAETGQKPRLVLGSEPAKLARSEENQEFGYICSNCGQTSLKWAGQCFSCSDWDTLERRIL